MTIVTIPKFDNMQVYMQNCICNNLIREKKTIKLSNHLFVACVVCVLVYDTYVRGL